MAWDARRATPARTVRALLADPRRLAGAAGALAWRARVRRRSALFGHAQEARA
jgi:hypothetical protein